MIQVHEATGFTKLVTNCKSLEDFKVVPMLCDVTLVQTLESGFLIQCTIIIPTFY
jgi:hypothetical protein